MTTKEIFALRRQGKIEEAYEAIRSIYKEHKGRYTTLCMFWTASDVFKKRLAEGRIKEAEKIYFALKRLVPSIEEKDRLQESKRGKKKDTVAGFMYYAEGRLIRASERFRKRYFAIRSKKKAASEREQNTDKQANGPEGPSKESEGTSKDLCHPCLDSNKVKRLLDILQGDMSVREMMAALNFHSRDKFLKNYLSPALKAGFVEMTQPNSPKSPTQKYRCAQRDKQE